MMIVIMMIKIIIVIIITKKNFQAFEHSAPGKHLSSSKSDRDSFLPIFSSGHFC